MTKYSYRPGLWDDGLDENDVFSAEWVDHPRLRFATREEAEGYARDAYRDSITRATESTDPVSARYADGQLRLDGRFLRAKYKDGYSCRVGLPYPWQKSN
jgi:hypothetical protein